MKVVVLAGGLGSRLKHITDRVPKPMAPVNGVPFLEHILDYLASRGAEEIVLAVSYKWEQIRDHFGSSYEGVPLRYSVESEPLGTGGAIQQAMERVDEEDVIVLNGDTLFPVDLEAMLKQHRESGTLLTIAVKQVDDAGRFGRLIVDTGGTISAFLEKRSGGGGLINGGVYIINKALFRRAAPGSRFSFEKDLLEPGVGEIRPRAFLSDAYFIDIGIPTDYERAQREVGLGRRSGPVS